MTSHALPTPDAPPPIDAGTLAGLLTSAPDSVLVIDARPFSSFVMNHIATAINVRLSNILSRRLAVGKISVEDLLCDAHRAVFHAKADSALLVIYDDRVAADCEAKLVVIKALQGAHRRTALLSCQSCACPTWS